MLSYLFKVLLLIIFSVYVIINYYYVDGFTWKNWWLHAWSFEQSYLPYVAFLLIFYGWYKYIKHWLESKIKEEVSYSPLELIVIFLINLFFICFLYFGYIWQDLSYWFWLFLKIISLLVFPLSIFAISTWFWKKILNYIPWFKEEWNTFKLLSSIWIWFISFLTLLITFWILDLYNFAIVLSILIFFIIFSYKEILELFESFRNYRIDYNLKEGSYLKLASAEMFFTIACLVFSVNLISLIRPEPIWWDDLGAYMNFPHLMAEAWNLLQLWWMYAWQSFTWIGYMIWTPTSAFFFNVMGGIMSFVVMLLIFWDLFHTKKHWFFHIPLIWKPDKKWFLSIPIILATIFISLPMVFFQQAKDMKVDEWLFFITAIWLYILYKYYLSVKDWKDKNLLYIWLIWIIAWFAFSIKFTAILYIAWILWVISYARLWFFGLLGYISIFIWVFTVGNLWKMMRVVINPEGIVWFERNFWIWMIWIWILFIIWTIFKNKINFKKYLKDVLVFLLWIFVILLPWFWKHISEAGTELSLSRLLSWKPKVAEFNIENIYSQEEIKEINQESKKARSKNKNSITTNEDFMRYLGYEKWILNHVKMPWNLTMQKNQAGEFTDISFLFLAFLPIILVFLRYRKKYIYWLIPVIGLFSFWVFNFWLLEFLLAKSFFPYWYWYLLLIFITSLIFFILNLKDTRANHIFILNLVFVSFYTFLWNISSFWIVWYWITMYFSFLLMIWYWIYSLSTYKDEKDEDDFLARFVWSFVVLFIILIYFFSSVIPHTFTNLKNAGYKEYKNWIVKQYAAKYSYHEYITSLYHLNIDSVKHEEFLKENIDPLILKAFPGLEKENIKNIQAILTKLSWNKDFSNIAKNSLKNLYTWISNPTDYYKNKALIYRSWTFLKYHISENNSRLIEDNLLYKFTNYISWSNSSLTVDRFKELWIKYVLVDLNAATIDNSLDHDLTKRYEKMLDVMKSSKIELIDTDSICLRLWIDWYNESNNIEDLMILWWVNYDSYDLEWKKIPRGTKKLTCLKYINHLIKSWKVDKDNFSYLEKYKNYMFAKAESWAFSGTWQELQELNKIVSNWSRVLFEIK